jgi:N-glycosylase/DNA lyase
MWTKLLYKGTEVTTELLSLKNTLMNGQCFNWKIVQGVYIGTLSKKVIALKEEDNFVFYKFLYNKHTILKDEVDDSDFFSNYFQFDVDISEIYSTAKAKLAKNLHASLDSYKGVRILKQEPFECIISFICSSNNNIERIRGMLENFRKTYGNLIYEDEVYGKFYSFPELQDFSSKLLEEKELRNMGYGYRAKYLVDSVNYMLEKGENWFDMISDSEDPVQELLNLKGVGRKVADCILLFSFRKHHIVPLDIHMIKFFNESVAGKGNKYKKIDKMSKKTYEEVSAMYFEYFGSHAGWLHSIFYMSRIDKSAKEEKSSKKNKESIGKRKSQMDSEIEAHENKIVHLNKRGKNK